MHNSRVETKIKIVDIENRNKKTYIFQKFTNFIKKKKINNLLDRL